MTQLTKSRYYLLDSFRGLVVISMILYHMTWDLVYLFGVRLPWFDRLPGNLWQQSICCSFILLSGFCCRMGRKKWRRGLTVFAGGAIVSLVTLLVMPEQKILFGVLTLLGSCMLLENAARPVLQRINGIAGLLISLTAFLVLRNIAGGSICFGLLPLPRWLYSGYVGAYLGLPFPGFYSTDYFPLIPWLFLFLTGYFLYTIAQTHSWLERLPSLRCRPLEWVGRHAMELYMVHQPLLYAILYLLL